MSLTLALRGSFPIPLSLEYILLAFPTPRSCPRDTCTVYVPERRSGLYIHLEDLAHGCDPLVLQPLNTASCVSSLCLFGLSLPSMCKGRFQVSSGKLLRRLRANSDRLTGRGFSSIKSHITLVTLIPLEKKLHRII